MQENDSFGHHYLTEELDHEILMHRDAHFAGDFKIMHDFYEKNSLWLHPEIEIDRIEYLARIEQELDQNLSDLLLSEAEQERVALAKKAYIKLKELYSDEKKKETPEQLLADLILTEDEEAIAEIDQILLQKERMVRPLLSLLEQQEAFDPLFPGYGYAPYFAILALGKIKDSRAIEPLFSLLGKELIFDEQVILDALCSIGKPAKDFLLKMVLSFPITNENMNAAYALSFFEPDLELSKMALNLLHDPKIRSNQLFATYLLCHLETPFAHSLKPEIKALAHSLSPQDPLRNILHSLINNL